LSRAGGISGMSALEDTGKTIVIRDRRKPNQYTTDNVIAREWLSILRVGDAFFFYSVYLSMSNKETESSWSSLRTLARYLQCGVDLIIRGNKLLEICELIHIETGDQRTSNEYYILDPPTLSDDLKERIYRRLDDILERETSVNWQAWARQVHKALDKHLSLPDIWSERRARHGGRPIKTARPENSACEPQPGLPDNGACEPQPGRMCPTTSAHVTHEQGVRDSQPEQEQGTSDHEQVTDKDQDSLLLLVQTRCRCLGITPQVIEVLTERYALTSIAQQLEWLPFRNARDPAGMLISAIQRDWTAPQVYDPEQAQTIWTEWLSPGGTNRERDSAATPAGEQADQDITILPERTVQAGEVWSRVLEELRMQMTRATYDTWLGGSEAVYLGEDDLTVRVRDEYAVEWLRTRLIGPIERTVVGIVGRPMGIRFEVQA
jgi:hypothetical protein